MGEGDVVLAAGGGLGSQELKAKPDGKEIEKRELSRPGDSFCSTLDLLEHFLSCISTDPHYTPGRQRYILSI
jgi:hypothetical protein